MKHCIILLTGVLLAGCAGKIKGPAKGEFNTLPIADMAPANQHSNSGQTQR